MKKYVTPTAEKIEFDYKDQVVASGQFIGQLYARYDGGSCESQEPLTGNYNGDKH